MKILKLTAAALATLPFSAQAQSTAETEDAIEDDGGCCSFYSERLPSRDMIVVTATGSDLLSRKSGYSVSNIGIDEIELRQPSTLSDLLATLPGVTVSNTGPIGGFSAVRIRGAEGEQTLTLIDGVRVNDPSSPGGGFDFGNLLIGNVDRVEVLRGPNSVPWGSQAIGGVVNIITARPGSTNNRALRAEYGSNSRTNLVGQYGISGDQISASLGGGYFRDDGISAAANGSEADGYRQYAANGALEVKLSDAVSIDLRGYYAHSRAELDGFLPPLYSLSDTPEYSTGQQVIGYAGINASFGDLQNRIALTFNDINRDNFAAPGAAAPDFLSRGRTERVEYQGDWQLAQPLRAVFGIEHERSRFTDGFAPAETQYSGAYAQAIIDPTDKLTITLGARVDDHKSFGTKATFSANAAWRPSAQTVIRAAYGEGFKAPTLYQLFSFYGDPGLKPEVAKSYELGFEQGLLDSQLRFGATAFQRRAQNMIDFDLLIYRYNNIIRSRAKGIETFVELRPSDHLSVRANYSYIDSEKREDGAVNFVRHLRRPVHSLNASIDWQASGKLKLGADLRLASYSLDGFGGSVRMDGYVLAGIRAAYDISDALELYGRVENAGDTDYQTVAGYKAYGRNAHIGLRAKF
ncbi:TonB-dependent receptor [Sphingorhabdus sp.]|uniref:TonB-dependent receptor plug domain-containing protein n=1 Tax=Sphingorhabdus sp. TaxID=1902408 RepID=UPI0032B7AD67